MGKKDRASSGAIAPLLAIVFVSLLLGMIACSSLFDKSSPSGFPFELMMQVGDLPSGWSYSAGTIPDEPGADSRLSSFVESKDPRFFYLRVSHELSVYPDEQSAKEAYPAWESGWFPTDAWQRPAEARFAPKDPNDQFRFACVPMSVNLVDVLSCGYLQRHKQIISLVLANLDEKGPTLAQLEHALGRVDERMQRY